MGQVSLTVWNGSADRKRSEQDAERQFPAWQVLVIAAGVLLKSWLCFAPPPTSTFNRSQQEGAVTARASSRAEMAENKMGPNLQGGAGFLAKRVQKSLYRAQEKVR